MVLDTLSPPGDRTMRFFFFCCVCVLLRFFLHNFTTGERPRWNSWFLLCVNGWPTHTLSTSEGLLPSPLALDDPSESELISVSVSGLSSFVFVVCLHFTFVSSSARESPTLGTWFTFLNLHFCFFFFFSGTHPTHCCVMTCSSRVVTCVFGTYAVGSNFTSLFRRQAGTHSH